VLLKTQTLCGERDAFSQLLKMNYPQSDLQIPHLLCSDRLRNPEVLGRAAKLSGIGHSKQERR
jgi:hypothetical protein